MSPVKRKYLKLAAGYVGFSMPRPVLIIFRLHGLIEQD